MQYITHRRFKGMSLCGEVNIPAMSECTLISKIIAYNGKAICYAGSENAHQYFACNDDGNGMERGELTQKIMKRLSKRDADYQVRWDKVWADETCQKYRRSDYSDYWLWNHDFYNADINDLRHIAELVA